MTKSFPSLPQRVLGLRRQRMIVSKDAPTPWCDVLEDRHSFSMVALVSEDYRVPPTHLKGLYRGRFQEETACLRVAARRKRETDKGPSPESKYFKPLARFSKRKFNQSRG